MISVIDTAATAHTVLLPPLILKVCAYTLSAARTYREQNDISGGLHLQTAGMKSHRLTLRGHIAETDRAGATVAFSDMLTNRTVLDFSIDGVRYSGFVLSEYTLELAEEGRAVAFECVLLGTAITQTKEE